MARNFLQELIAARLSALEMSKRDLVTRAGYTNTAKGLRRLEMLEDFDFESTGQLIGKIPELLGVTAAEVEEAIALTKSDVRRELDEEWRREFRPFARVRTGERGRPKQITIAGLINAGRFVYTYFSPDTPEEDYIGIAVEAFRKYEKEVRGLFFPPEGIVVNYTPDRAAFYSLEGEFLNELDGAERPARFGFRVR